MSGCRGTTQQRHPAEPIFRMRRAGTALPARHATTHLRGLLCPQARCVQQPSASVLDSCVACCVSGAAGPRLELRVIPAAKCSQALVSQSTQPAIIKWAYEFGQNLYYVDTCEPEQVGAQPA